MSFRFIVDSYVFDSSKIDLQLQALKMKRMGCRRIFQEKISGNGRNRPIDPSSDGRLITFEKAT
jgi:hypothetical protein